MTEIVLTLKGDGPSEPWLVIHADTVDELTQIVSDLSEAELKAYQEASQAFRGRGEVPNKATISTEAAAAAVERELGATEVEAPIERKFTTIDGDLPKGVKIWVGPNPDSEKAAKGYEELFFSFPYISNDANRNRLMKPLKDVAWAKFDSGSKAWYVAKRHEPFVRETLAAHADLFA